MFNTEWGLEAELPPTPVPGGNRPRVAAAFVAHLGGRDEPACVPRINF
ncbi:hypothetical protein AB0I51_18025 [Streptomyces sp. NPDC050549]